MKSLKIHEFAELTEAVVNSLLQLEAEIFDEPLNREILERELTGQANLCILISYYDNLSSG